MRARARTTRSGPACERSSIESVSRAAAPDTRALRALARRYGVQPSYRAGNGERVTPSPEAILRALQALGAPVDHLDDVDDALWEAQEDRTLAILGPVTVVWADGERTVRPRRLRTEAGLSLACVLETETGETREWSEDGDLARVPSDVDIGYHTLHVTLGGRRSATTRLFLAPREAHDPAVRAWGVFLPLYALRTRASGGAADLADLERLMEWTMAIGGRCVATLPLFAAFLSEPCDPNPYAPVSRLFWNELYVNVDRAPEMERSPAARALREDSELRAEIVALRRDPRVDYRRAYAARRRILEPLAETFFDGDGPRSEPFLRFLDDHPEARAYAGFRAACEARGVSWHAWPLRLRQGVLATDDYPADAARFHLYCQWLADRQMAALAETATSRGMDLFLDLPVGVHADGYDAWRYSDQFCFDARTGGRDGALPPLHPERIRETGYAYVIAAVRNLCRYAGILRVDDVMSLHRQFWIPAGGSPADGVYVRYRADELWAILCIESRRSRTAIVAEERGPVPAEVRERRERHAARRVYVVPCELVDGPEPALAPIPARSVASLDTPATPPFAAWWRAADEGTRRTVAAALARAGQPVPSGPAPPTERARAALLAAHRALAASDARLVLVNLEDLWLEESPHEETWRRKARYALETFTQLPEVIGALTEIRRLRGP